MKAQLASGRQGGSAVTFPQFLEMFRSELLDLREILAFLQMGSAAPDGLATQPQVTLKSNSPCSRTPWRLRCGRGAQAWPKRRQHCSSAMMGFCRTEWDSGRMPEGS